MYNNVVYLKESTVCYIGKSDTSSIIAEARLFYVSLYL